MMTWIGAHPRSLVPAPFTSESSARFLRMSRKVFIYPSRECLRSECEICDQQRAGVKTNSVRSQPFLRRSSMKARYGALLLAVPFLAGASQVFTTPTGATVSDGSVGATATFSLVNGNLQVVLA